MGMKTIASALVLAATFGGAFSAPAMADNGRHRGWYKHGHEDERYYRDDRRRYYSRQGCRTSGTTGLVVGAGAGALLGRSVDRYGDRLPGTIIGAGAGALIGKEIDSKHRC